MYQKSRDMKKLAVLILIFFALSARSQSRTKTENIILITLDGMRWQDVFTGADSSLMYQQEHLKDSKIKEKFWRETASERRKLLFPFLWTTIASQGQVYGNRILGNKMNVTNNQWFSYPGYNELLSGKADNERIHSNDKFYNPNTTVLEFFNKQPLLKGKVAAFTSWDVFSYIINDKRSGVFVSAGLVGATGSALTEREKTLNELMPVIPNTIPDVRPDAFTFQYGFEYLKRNKPKVMFFSFDETDDFAHGGEYGAYLNSARNTDGFIAELWNYLQSDPMYKNKTTIVITCDHGRGNNATAWKSHGAEVKGSDQIWMAIIGPDTAALGEIKTQTQLYQDQIAKTLAALMGLNYTNQFTIGETIPGVVAK
jgi:Type I phosphodiesterase / nucleotide pyrophosphatase